MKRWGLISQTASKHDKTRYLRGGRGSLSSRLKYLDKHFLSFGVTTLGNYAMLSFAQNIIRVPLVDLLAEVI